MLSLAELLPQAAPMILLSGYSEPTEENTVEAFVDIDEQSPFYEVGLGGVPGCVALEYMAQTMAMALRLALADAGLAPTDIGYVNAHGTATDLGDVAEGTATAAVFGAHRPPLSTIKSYTGHTLGACGAIEAILTIEMLRQGWFAPNLNLTDPDPRCGDHDFIVGDGRRLETEFAMSDNFAFGGVNTSLVFRRA